MGRLQNTLLIRRIDLLPDLLTHDQNIRNHGMLVHGINLADLAVLSGGQCRLIVFRAVDNAGLQ